MAALNVLEYFLHNPGSVVAAVVTIVSSPMCIKTADTK